MIARTGPVVSHNWILDRKSYLRGVAACCERLALRTHAAIERGEVPADARWRLTLWHHKLMRAAEPLDRIERETPEWLMLPSDRRRIDAARFAVVMAEGRLAVALRHCLRVQTQREGA